MPQTQPNFSEWAKTYNSRIQPTPVSIWHSNDGFLWKAAILIGLTYMVWSEKFSLTLLLGSKEDQEITQDAVSMAIADHHEYTDGPTHKNRPTKAVKVSGNSAAKTTHAPVRRDERSEAYIKRFAPVAVAEMRKFGIPASIILAQGLLESSAGNSGLAQKANNHFGIKCFSRHCKRGHCMNYSDDTHKDFFVKYNNAWSSYRAHSEFLKKANRYSHLFKSRNYETWAKGLERAGYATDKKYAEKLIGVIIRYDLHQFDTNS